MIEKVQVFLFFLMLKSPKCCVLQAKIKFFMKSIFFLFFLFVETLWLWGAIPHLACQAVDPVS